MQYFGQKWIQSLSHVTNKIHVLSYSRFFHRERGNNRIIANQLVVTVGTNDN
jgi:hypothetical protein